MGILTRFTDIMKSNINALLDKCEDPAKMIDQTLRDLREDLAEVKKETANIIADAKSADRQVKECEEEITKYTTAAQNALKAGNDDDARTLIAKKQQYESNLVSYKKTQELTHANADKMRQMHDKLVNDIETLEAMLLKQQLLLLKLKNILIKLFLVEIKQNLLWNHLNAMKRKQKKCLMQLPQKLN